jgi:arylsulfatase A-like enzyme
MRKRRRTFEICMTGITATLVACNGPAESKKPNIVIILADDMGWGDINANGNDLISTPVLNRLMSESLSFDRFYVCPLSAPTRAQMLTGRYFLRTGVSSVTRGYENMRSDEVTIAEVLKDNCYATGCFGKWHNGRYYPQHPNRQGFNEFVGFPVGHLGYYYNAFYLHNDEEKQSEGYTSDYFTAKALDFIERNKDNSFLCYIPYNVPHSPFQVPSGYFEKYIAAGLDSTLASVYGMVENMDENIGKVLEKLDELELAESTIVIFLSDNGPNTERYNGGMKGRKGSVDEGGVRVPFYIKWPGNIKPGKTDQLAQDIDIMPTLLGLCGLKYEQVKPFDGIDLSGIINGKEKPFDRLLFSRQGNQDLENCNSSVRNDTYKLVLTRKDTLLYNMQNDPEQKNDIFETDNETTIILVNELKKLNYELISEYQPVTTIEAGFAGEKSFTLPVQDASLSGKIRYSSIHPNQSHTENWTQTGDSVSWTLNIHTPGVYKAELQYGCPESETGSVFILRSGSSEVSFNINKPFDSQILPDRDYVKRSESVERTWTWMTAGNLELRAGSERITLILKEKKRLDAGLIKSVRLTAVNPVPIPPYPESQIISGMDIDWTTHQRHAEGSDNFQLTWADDDHQYGIWGDGDGFAATNGEYSVSMGVARIEANYIDYTGYDRY